MQAIPAIDVLGGEAVRLERGDYSHVIARRSLDAHLDAVLAESPPLLHLVDLDGARSGEANPALVAAVAARAGTVAVQAAGGIRSAQAAAAVLNAGAARIVVSTAAFAGAQTLAELVAVAGARLVVAIDVRYGRIALSGWRETTSITVAQALERLRRAGVARVIGTAIRRDGTLQGPDLALYRELCASPLAVIAAGGVRDHADLAALAGVGCEAAILGRALFEPRAPDGS